MRVADQIATPGPRPARQNPYNRPPVTRPGVPSVSNDWSMPPRTERCAACGHPFEVGEAFQACLVQAGEDYLRQDFCLTCPPPVDPQPVGVWRTRRPEPATRRLQPFDREAICTFFERLDDTDDPARRRFRFVLALLLWRKKILKLDHTRTTDQGEVWEFSMPRTSASYLVPQPALDVEQLEHLSEQLERLLAGQSGEFDGITTDLHEDGHNA